MAPKTKKTTVEFTTETFVKHITDKMKKPTISSMTELGELVVQQWQLALFEMPKEEVKAVCDYIYDNEGPRDLCASLNSVVFSI